MTGAFLRSRELYSSHLASQGELIWPSPRPLLNAESILHALCEE